MFRGQRDDPLSIDVELGVRADEQGVSTLGRDCGEGVVVAEFPNLHDQ
jgi:hypothetical protein